MTQVSINIPAEINKILTKAKNLRGYNLLQLASYLNIYVPQQTNNNKNTNTKGLTGQLIEFLLGASAGSKPMPDFPELGLEIKTLPINLSCEPQETTYVCVAQLISKNNNVLNYNFKDSLVSKKLSHVLWLPIIVSHKENNTNLPGLANRIIGNAFLWQPNEKQYQQLEADWLELTEMLLMGNIEQVSSHYGKVMQIRPKAANSKSLTSAIGPDGATIATIPRGFYLRTNFTKEIYLANSKGNDILP